MINTILTGWSFVRILRLVIGVSALAAYFSEHDSFMGLLGLIVTAQAVFNVGCCGVSSCSTKATVVNSKEVGLDKTEILYEEIK